MVRRGQHAYRLRRRIYDPLHRAGDLRYSAPRCALTLLAYTIYIPFAIVGAIILFAAQSLAPTQ